MTDKTRFVFKAAGVTFGNRQNYLGYLLKHPEARIVLWREPQNKYDKNAIKILAVTDKRLDMGYVPRELAQTLAPQMDAKKFVKIDRFAVTGTHKDKKSFGMTLYATI